MGVLLLLGAQFTPSCCSPFSRFELGHIRSLKQPGFCPDDACDSETSPTETQFPFMAVVKDGSGRTVCSGSLIHDNVVLTAAHCVDILENPRVELGVFGAPGSVFESFGTTAKILHPDFDKDEQGVLDLADVALLVLDRPSVSAKPVTLGGFPHPGCFMRDQCMQVNLPVISQTPKGPGSYDMKSQKVVVTPFNDCWTALGSPHREKDPAVCLSGLKENTVSCNGDGGPMMSSDWQQTGIMSFTKGCTDTKAMTAHTLITPEIKDWIDGQVEEVKAGRPIGTTNGGIIAPPYCFFRNGFWFGGSDCRTLPKPTEEKGCVFLHGTWFGSGCPERQADERRVEPRARAVPQPKQPEPQNKCAFLFGRWIGQNCATLGTLEPKKAGCIFQYGQWIGAGC